MRRGLIVFLALAAGGCKCVDLERLTAVACEEGATCADGKVCCPDGLCRSSCSVAGDGGTPRACSPVNCRGCCSGDVCELGIDLATCGQSGQVCQNCPAGAKCQGGGCSGCDESNCGDGCCFSGACETPSLSRCGADGGICKDCALVGGDECRGGMCFCGGAAACGLGEACEAGQCVCDPSTCSGCCSGSSCVLTPNFAACGTSGLSCSACSATNSDRCTGGACVCGSAPNATACGPGQVCANGACECDPATCAGCCAANQCVAGTQNGACGSGGVMCQACNGSCTNQACEGCDSASCPTGCCSAGSCVQQSGQTLNTCGRGGNFCNACNLTRADNCSNGQCQCGSNPSCTPGQHCVGGACECDSTSCNGCCATKACIGLGNQDEMRCGAGAAACVDCRPRGDTCANGACRCGGASPCQQGQECVGGVCVCNSNSCLGCCQGNACTNQTVGDGGAVVCGISGSACAFCSPGRADNCGPAGSCRCGVGNQCAAGLACANGTCVCSATSCPVGCCASAAGPCRVPDNANCGIGGSTCFACSVTKTDRCVNGLCTCGNSGGICETESVCSDGVCECQTGLCTDGCCDGPQCARRPPEFPSTQYCGMGGTCAACTNGGSEACEASTGLCEKCENCSNGCCFGSTCQTTGFPFCGSPGGACTRCRDGGADTCDGVACSCGSIGKQCALGESCINGDCVCNPDTCQGCCTGGPAVFNRCVADVTASQCGANGGQCSPCNPTRADRCLNGGCRCGNGPACTLLNTCQAGLCLPP